MTTQLTQVNIFNQSSMIFSEAKEEKSPSGVSFGRRINIQTRNPNGTTGDLIFATPANLFSFGVSANTDPGSGAITGYTFPLCLFDRDGATPEQQKFVECFDSVVDAVKDHVLSVKDEINKFDLEQSDLRKLNPLYWKKEADPSGRGLRVVPGTGPTLYAKCMYSKKNDAFASKFYVDGAEECCEDPKTLIGTFCHATAAIKIESIFVGNKISLQVKIVEADISPQAMTSKRLLGRPTATPGVSMTKPSLLSTNNPMAQAEESDESDSDSDIEIPAPVVAKKVVRKVSKK